MLPLTESTALLTNFRTKYLEQVEELYCYFNAHAFAEKSPGSKSWMVGRNKLEIFCSGLACRAMALTCLAVCLPSLLKTGLAFLNCCAGSDGFNV